MSLTDLSKMYERMLQNPENRKSSSGTMKQVTPYDSGVTDQTPSDTSKSLDTGDVSYLAEMDRRIAARKAGSPIVESGGTSPDDSRIMILENKVSELQELMKEMMKTHMKLLEKVK